MLIPSSMITGGNSGCINCLVEILVKGSKTSCSCGDQELNYLLFVFSEKLSLWVGWVYWVVGFIESVGFGVFCLFWWVCFVCVFSLFCRVPLFGYLSVLHTNCFVLE